jgi:arabinose-5-phosphate isomerase
MMNEDGEQWLSEGRRVLTEEAKALLTIAERLDGVAWIAAVDLILKVEGRVVVTGMGKSGAVGRKLASTLASTGTHALFMHPAEAVHGDLGMLAKGDVVVALSYSGETDEILALLPAISSVGVPILSLTSNLKSTLAENSVVTLDISIGQEACPMNLAPTTSTTAMIAVGDALALTVMKARQFTSEDYARLHPGGALGRRLTLRVSDIMRSGENVAIVSESATMTETVFAITNAHAGAAIVTDPAGRVCGLITDGDIRRHLLDDQNMLTRSAGSIMNSHPGVVSPDILAVDGLRLLDDFHPLPGSRAGEAPVVDAEHKPVGMLMLKDLVKTGIVTE